METLLLLVLVVVTSAAAVAIGRWRGGVSASGLTAASSAAMRVVGWSVVFLAVNVGVGIVVVLAARATGHAFVSAYVLDDVSLVVLSALQGVVAGSYRRTRR